MGVEDYFDFLWFNSDEEPDEDQPNDLELARRRAGTSTEGTVNQRWQAWKRAQEDAYADTLLCACGRSRCGGGSYCEHAQVPR